MKKNMMMILILAIAGVASAAFIEGDFEDSTVGAIPSDVAFRPGDEGWATRSTGPTIEANGGIGDSQYAKNTAAATSTGKAVAQWFTLDQGTYKMVFYYQLEDGGTAFDGASFTYNVWENNGLTSYHADAGLGSTTGITLDAGVEFFTGLEAVSLAAVDSGDGSTWIKVTTAEFTLDATTTHVGVGFWLKGIDSDNGQYMGIDNVSITDGGPEPARGSVFILK